MAVDAELVMRSPVQIADTGGSNPVTMFTYTGAPDGDAEPWTSAAIGSLYFRTDATDDTSPLYVKVDEDSADADWVKVMIKNDEDTTTMEGAVTFGTDTSLYFRDAGIRLYSSADGQFNIYLTGSDVVRIGADGTNHAQFDTDGELTLAGTAQVTRNVPLPISTGGGTSTVELHNGLGTINLDADGETWYFSFEAPKDWDAASDMTYVAMVVNEIAETDSDDISFTGQVRGYGYAAGEVTSDAGQTVAVLQELTGGDEAINFVNKVTGTIDWNHGTYPIAAGDAVVAKFTVNLTDGTECTGPLWIAAHWIEYTASKLGA